MFDPYVIVSMLNWKRLDKETWKRRAKMEITQAEYDKYLENRSLIEDIMNHGDVHLCLEKSRQFDDFVHAYIYTSGLIKGVR